MKLWDKDIVGNRNNMRAYDVGVLLMQTVIEKFLLC